jgi:hypothetical protein
MLLLSRAARVAARGFTRPASRGLMRPTMMNLGASRGLMRRSAPRRAQGTGNKMVGIILGINLGN